MPKPTYEELEKAFREAIAHLCGFGDAWERECAQDSGLMQRLDDTLKALGPEVAADVE